MPLVARLGHKRIRHWSADRTSRDDSARWTSDTSGSLSCHVEETAKTDAGAGCTMLGCGRLRCGFSTTPPLRRGLRRA